MSAHRVLEVDGDISAASTLPAWVYSDPELFARVRERVFVPSWQLVADTDRVKVPGQVCPVTMLEGLLDEPLLLARDQEDRLHCLSNVCTHRGNIVVESEGVQNVLRCRYHGRRFTLAGRFHSMPEFEKTQSFPTDADHLPRVPFDQWGPFLFASLRPALPLEALVGAMEARCGWMPIREAVLETTRSREYLVRANWALYCDNYLEGFHIPYVHAALASSLDYGQYATEIHPFSVLQLGVAKEGEDAFDPPASSPDHGRRIAAYYWWLYPNTMVNFYPWGLSVNVVRPLAVDRTKVVFLAYIWDRARYERGAAVALDRVEREDEVIVESVQRGVRARLYERGRYSPSREQGVHHFHRLLVRSLEDGQEP